MASVNIRCDLGILVQPFSAVGPTALSIKNTEIKVTKCRCEKKFDNVVTISTFYVVDQSLLTFPEKSAAKR